MEQALKEADALCPMYNVTQTIKTLYALTKFSDKIDQLASFACQYADALREMTTIGYWNGSMYIIGFLFGVPSAILAILTFFRKEFDTVSFFYHRVINIIELLYMAFIFENALEWMTGDLKARSWAWCQYLRYFHYKLDQALPLAIQLIIVWVAIERVTICFASRFFDRINRRSVAYGIVFGSLVASIAMYSPLAFTTTFAFNNTTHKYARVKAGFANTSGYDIYVRFMASFAFIQLALMTAATAATIAGLIQTSRRKRRLALSAGAKSINGRELFRQISINSQLCLLQLCESVPVVINCLLLVCIQTSAYTMDTKQLVSMTYEEAVYNLFLFRRYLYLGIIQTGIDLIEHCTHFYRYLIFSRKVKTTISRMCKKNTVSQVSIIAS